MVPHHLTWRRHSHVSPTCRTNAGSGPPPPRLNNLMFRPVSVNYRRSCLSCCWSKGVEWPAKRCYVGLVAVGVQEQAEDILIPPLVRNCLILMTFPLLVLSSPQNSGPCNSLYCLGHFKMSMMMMMIMMMMLTRVTNERVGRLVQVSSV